MTTGIVVRRVLPAACYVFALVFGALFTIVVVTKITTLSLVPIISMGTFGGGAATLLLAGRALSRRS